MVESANAGHLDQLVIKYVIQNVGLEILESAPEQDRSAIFLSRIGWGQKKDYIEDTLNSYLSESLRVNQVSDVYVFTHDDSFKYQKNNGGVSNIGIGNSRRSGPTFSDVLEDILKSVERDMHIGKFPLANILFFDDASKKKFEKELNKKLKKRDSYALELKFLNVPNYGTITLHQYAIK